MRNAFADIIGKLYHENSKILSLVVDSGTDEYDEIRKKYPDRLVECGIAESNALGVAAGLASCGNIPVIHGMSAFLVYRGYEFIRDDICLQNQNVKILGTGAGIIYNNLGPTHHATEDIAIIRTLPYITILSPASPKEVEPVLRAAIEIDGPVYIRFGKAWEPEVYEGEPDFTLGKGSVLKKGTDLTVIATGSIVHDAVTAAADLDKEGISLRVIHMSTIKPIDEQCILKAAVETKGMITLEEHSINGGLGGAVAEVLSKNGKNLPFQMMGFDNRFCTDYGWYQDIKKRNGFSDRHVYETCRKMWNKIEC